MTNFSCQNGPHCKPAWQTPPCFRCCRQQFARPTWVFFLADYVIWQLHIPNAQRWATSVTIVNRSSQHFPFLKILQCLKLPPLIATYVFYCDGGHLLWWPKGSLKNAAWLALTRAVDKAGLDLVMIGPLCRENVKLTHSCPHALLFDFFLIHPSGWKTCNRHVVSF